MNRYDLEHICTKHPKMSAEEWHGIYDRAWNLYYSPKHVETLLRRARASGIKPSRVAYAILCYYGSYRFERLHPLQCGLIRRKVRTTRRPGFPIENPLLFYPKHVWDMCTKYASLGAYYLWLERLRGRVERDPKGAQYMDAALRVEARATSQAA